MLVSIGLVAAWSQETGRWTANIGGGMSFPVGQTSDFAHLGGNFVAGGGIRIVPNQSLLLQYDAFDLPINDAPKQLLAPLDPKSTVYSVTLNYRVEFGTSHLRPYVIGGGGWYRRSSNLSTASAGAEIACSSALLWLGYACEAGFADTTAVVRASTSNVFGYNGGAGVSYPVFRGSTRFFVEARYHSAPHNGVATRSTLLDFGLSW